MNAQPLSDSPAVTDADLLAAWRHGDAGAFDLLYARHRAPVYGFLLRLLGNRALADDVHQDLWLQVIERAGDFRAGGNVRTWLFTLARSRALDRLRREAVRDGARGRNPDARAYRIDPESRTAAYTSHEAGSDEAISDEAGLPDAVLGESVLGQAGRGALGAGDAPAEARLQGERAALLQRALAQLRRSRGWCS